MGNVVVDQIGHDGSRISDIDTTLTETQKNALLLEALPSATTALYGGQRVIKYRDQVILKAQVTYLGIPWEPFKKRIQISRRWVEAHDMALADRLTPRFVGIYYYNGVTIFVDFDPTTYVTRKANNSAAHIATNDLYQAQTRGIFSRTDKNGNRHTSVRFDLFANYLLGQTKEEHSYINIFRDFNIEFLTGARIEALDAVQEMHGARWPDTMQGEWAGFYLEYRLDEYLRRSGAHRLITFQRKKGRGVLDYDLIFRDGGYPSFYGDLKASNISRPESPGNDAERIQRCLATYARFWYVIYEHDTWHSRDEGDQPVLEWNEWRRSAGHVGRKEYDRFSYARRFKSAVQFARMRILEVNEANFHMVLGNFHQGRQPDGAARALKVMISKRNTDNFLIFSARAD